MPDAPLAQYSFRRSVLETGARYSLYDDRLVIEGGNAPRTIPLADVRGVHLKYERTKQRGYFQCRIHTTGARIDLRHVDWVSFGKFTDQRRTYTPFLKALLRQLSHQPNVKFRAGSMANFLFAILGVPVMITLGVMALRAGLYGRASLAGFFTALCIAMIPISRPHSFDPLAPPADLLPQ